MNEYLCYTCGGLGILEDVTYMYSTDEEGVMDVETWSERISASWVCPDCLGLGVWVDCETDEGLVSSIEAEQA